MTLWDKKFESEKMIHKRIAEINKSEGRKEGRKDEKKSVANKMLSKEMPIELISEMTGLFQKEISKIVVNI